MLQGGKEQLRKEGPRGAIPETPAMLVAVAKRRQNSAGKGGQRAPYEKEVKMGRRRRYENLTETGRRE